MRTCPEFGAFKRLCRQGRLSWDVAGVTAWSERVKESE
jgi:hypothetical protein